MTNEKTIKPIGGFIILVLLFIIILSAGYFFITLNVVLAAICMILAFFILPGFFIVNPNEAKVLVFFGKYVGTVKDNGFFWVNPFYIKSTISLRARNLNGHKLKVNDKIGNPIEIATVVVWEVKDTAKALFEVDDYVKFVDIQSEAAVRKLASSYPYDNIEDEHADIYLRDSTGQVNTMLEHELHERLERAGVEILEARISHLAYAAEIAGAMLQRQQATAIVAARKQIVDGAVGMVEMALDRLENKKIIKMDDERKALMVSNLLVVLCSERAASPVVNTGL
ncbi:MAG: SPFH domain-containing protein [Saprospiraceae bacterium]|nr:SPFH domain-containing protein [Saprospiraceae bacterium]